MKSGFIYLWLDKKRKKYYLGSHLGTLDDGYVGSNRRFYSAYKSRPNTFKRKILQFFVNITSKELLQKEQNWLNLIKKEELFIKYYNEKNVAAGGDIISCLSEQKRLEHSKKCRIASKKYWNNITSDEYELRKTNAFGGNTFNRNYLKQRNKDLCSKQAMICSPDGSINIINNISDFCKDNNLNYGNMKSVLRGDRKTCKGYTGHYI